MTYDLTFTPPSSLVLSDSVFRQISKQLERLSCWSNQENVCAGGTLDEGLRDPRIEALELEARILYSAAPVPLDLAIDAPAEVFAADLDSARESGQPEAFTDVPAETEREIVFDDPYVEAENQVSLYSGEESAEQLDLVFIDESVADNQRLIDGIWSQLPNALVFELDADQNGIEAITAILSERSDVRSVHIVSHGQAGEVQLGNTTLSQETLNDYDDQLKLWRNSLTADADLFFYGCDLAADDQGERLVDEIAQLTEADVAASDDLTGHQSLGGDWELEYEVGHVDSNIFASSSVVAAWEHTLAVAQSGDVSTDTTPEVDDSDSTNHTTLAGADRLLLVGVSFGANLGETVDSITYNGDSLILAGEIDHADGDKARVEVWYLVAPDVGTDLDLDITYTGDNHSGVTYGVVSFTGVDQLSPLGGFFAAQGNSNSPSVTSTSADGDLVLGVVAAHNNDAEFTPGAGQTELWDLHTDEANGTASLQAGSNSVVSSFNSTENEEWVAAGVPIRSASVSASPEPPETQDVTASGGEDGVVEITLTGTDADGTVDSFLLSSLPANGTLYTDATLSTAVAAGVDYNATGGSRTFYFDPASDWNGTTSFNYAARDNDGQTDSSPATATLNVAPVNDAPVITSNGGAATADIDVDENQTFVTTVSASDVDNASNELTYLITGGIDASHFTIDSASGDLTFVTAKDFENPEDLNADGRYRVEVSVFDPDGAVDSQSITVNVRNGNERPYIESTITDLIVDEDFMDQSLNLRNVFEDNEDADSDLTFTVENVTNPSLYNSVIITPDGFITVDFAENQNGSSMITIRATDTGGLFVDIDSSITVNPVNDDPFVASPVPAIVVDEDAIDTVIDLSLVFDDVDILTNSDSLSYSLVSNTNLSLVTASLAGSQLTLDYQDEQFGNSSVVVRATDLAGRSVEETIDVSVRSVNDDPQIAGNLSYSRSEDDPSFVIDLLDGASDADAGDSLRISNLTLLSGDDRGVSSSGDTLNVDPSRYEDLTTGQSEVIEYAYSIVDGNGGTANQMVQIVIDGVNDAPVAVSPIGTVTANEDDPTLTVDLTSIFEDRDNDVLSYRLVSTNGAWLADASVMGSDLVVNYQPDQYGQAEMVVEAVDAMGLTARETIRFDVNPVNDLPVVQNHSFESAAEESVNPLRQVTGDLLVGAVDIDNDLLTVNLIDAPANGTIDLNPDGTFTFTPDSNFLGTETIRFTATDGTGTSEIGTATLIVSTPLLPNTIQSVSEESEEEELPFVSIPEELVAGTKGEPIVPEKPAIPAVLTSSKETVSAVESNVGLVVVNDRRVIERVFRESSLFDFEVRSQARENIDEQDSNELAYSAEFSASLDEFGNSLELAGRQLELSQLSMAVSISGVSIGFVSLVLRAGALVASMMVNVPAWRMMDPLCVLGYADDESDDEDESLLDIVESDSNADAQEVAAACQPQSGIVHIPHASVHCLQQHPTPVS